MIAVVLGWPLDYLVNILHGEADKNLRARILISCRILPTRLTAGLEIGALREDGWVD